MNHSGWIMGTNGKQYMNVLQNQNTSIKATD
jgi:hypothetical protein